MGWASRGVAQASQDGTAEPSGGASASPVARARAGAAARARVRRRERARRRGRWSGGASGSGGASASPVARARTGLEPDRRELRGQGLATVTVSIATGDVAMLYGLPELGIAAIASTALIPEVTLPMIW
jgi:hypothetical protein